MHVFDAILMQGEERLPGWAFSLLLLGGALVLALVAHFVLVRLLKRGLDGHDSFWRPFVFRTRGPTRIGMAIVALGAAAPLAPLSLGEINWLRHLLLIGFVVLIGWISLIALDLAAALYLRARTANPKNDFLARKQLTQIKIFQRALATLVVVITGGMALMTIGSVRQWGVSLLAAGGAASVIVGLALQPLLSNLIAGLQMAVTQPIRLGDDVVVEGEFGTVEEIEATYVVVRLWDWRRMVLPLTYFNQRPFQNWSRESSSLIGTVMLYVDYAAPVAALRRRLEEVVRASPKWDGQVISLQVTDFRDSVMELRCLASARSAPDTFDLRCEVREALIGFLQADHPYALPRRRQEVELPIETRAEARPPAPARRAASAN
jgi:small-conductance mechanosensitive channel